MKIVFEHEPKISLVNGPITKLHVDVIVNAAKSSLMGGGGVDGAIHAAGGIQILKECYEVLERQGECMPGQTVSTTAGNLPAKWVIHTVGPVGKGLKHEDEDVTELLWLCYFNSLNRATELGATTIAFPNISTGAYGFNKELAARMAIDSVKAFFIAFPNTCIQEVIFCCFEDENFEIYKSQLSIPLESEENTNAI